MVPKSEPGRAQTGQSTPQLTIVEAPNGFVIV